MNLILRSRGTELNERLREYATEKLTRVQRFFDRIIKMEVELLAEPNPRVRDDHRVEVTVKTPRDTLRAHGAAGDFFTAIDQAADRLEVQVKRFKGRLMDRGGRNDHRNDMPPVEDLADLEPIAGAEATAEAEAPEIVSVPQQIAKPMTPEEAVLELESRSLGFLLFTDARTMRAGVVYRRSDGTYGLIEHRT